MLLKSLKTNKPISVSDTEGALLIKSGDFEKITAEQFADLRERESSTIGAIARFTGDRDIHTMVTKETLRKFSNRLKTEGVDLKKGLATLVEQYADGAMLVMPKAKNKNVNYAKEHTSS